MQSPKTILRYVVGLVAVFGVGFLLLVILHFSFMRLLHNFDVELENERARIALGEEIIANIIHIERNFYQLATTATSGKSVEKILSGSDAYFGQMEKAFHVLKKGGVLPVTIRLNEEGMQDFVRTITYHPGEQEGYFLEISALRPKVLEIRRRMQTLAALVATRNRLMAGGDSRKLQQVREEILLFLEKSPAYFVRLHENANRLSFQGYQNLQRLREEIARRQVSFKRGAIAVMVAIIGGVLVICWRSARQIYAVHSQLDSIRSEMEQAKKGAEAANKIKTDFMATMSHEVRTPLNIIIGMTGLIIDTELTPIQQRYVARIQSAGELLLGLMNDILDFSRIEERNLEFVDQPFDLREVVFAVAEVVRGEARQKGIAVEAAVAPSPWVPGGDPVRMRQILLILASNAVKFTEQGRVTMRGRLEDLDERQILAVVEVSDTGIGIAQEQLATIFETFAQGDASVTRKYGGTGLGLAISNQLAKLMGGKITVDSTVGTGSTFTLTLPMRKIAGSPLDQEHQGQPLFAEKPVANLDILLAEEEIEQAEVARAILEEAGHRVKTVENGLEALRSLAKFQYDVIFLPVDMAVLDGVSTARDIRAFERGDNVERAELGYDVDWLAARLKGQHIFLVAVDDRHLLDSASQEGALFDGHIARPYERQSLLNLVGRLAAGEAVEST